MKVILTGGTGFLGRAMHKAFAAKGWQVVNIGRSSGNDIVCDLSEAVPDLSELQDELLVVHAAGKAHIVPKTEAEALDFHKINVEGTAHLLQGLSGKKIHGFVFISSVSVYGLENGTSIPEAEPLKGNSPYAESKIASEKLVREWGIERNIPVLILRLPLVAGSRPPGNLGKMISAIKKGTYFGIGKSLARRSMVLADDIGELICRRPDASGTYNLTDGIHPSFREMETLICRQLNKRIPFSIPMFVARILGALGNIIPGAPVNSATISKMTNDLTFDDSKARKELGWKPKPILEHLTIS